MKAGTRLIVTTAVATLALVAGRASAAEDCQGSPGDGAVKLTVATSNLRSAEGEVAVTVYPDDSKRFLAKGGKLARVRTPAAQPTTRACFWLPPGTYAVAVYHDENGDGAFDRSIVGAPKEGYGFSNDAPANMGLPDFAAVRFKLPAGGRTISVHMRYP